jgi:hypothetical protein
MAIATKTRSNLLTTAANRKYNITGLTPKVVQATPPDISLAEFVRESWHVLEGSTPLAWNWHIEAVCLHAEAILFDWLDKKNGVIAEQRMQNLLINIPPGSMKSRIISVCLPAWFWLYDASWRSIFIAANPRVAQRDSLYCKDIIESDWYQNKFNPQWRLKKDQNTKNHYATDRGGFRKSFGFFAKIVGDRADFLCFDDPHDADEVHSEKRRLSVLERWDSSIFNRVNDLRISVRLGIMQRLHEDDLAGHVFASGQWDRLSIEQEFSGNAIATPIGWIDPRKTIGELMFPERFPIGVLLAEKERMGSYGYSGQHQQNPSPSGGGMFKIENWRIYIPGSERYGTTILSMDASFKGDVKNDFVVVGGIRQQTDVVAPQINPNAPQGIFRRHRYYVPYRERLKAGITEAQAALRRSALMFPMAHTKLVEDKANGSAIIEQMSAEMRGVTPYNPGSNSKTARAQAIVPIQDRGDIALPCADWAVANLRSMGVTSCTLAEYWAVFPAVHRSTAEYAPVADWVKEFIDELSKFPNGSNDDQVDFLTQAILWLESQVNTVTTMGTSRAEYR